MHDVMHHTTHFGARGICRQPKVKHCAVSLSLRLTPQRPGVEPSQVTRKIEPLVSSLITSEPSGSCSMSAGLPATHDNQNKNIWMNAVTEWSERSGACLA
jgi:hypothetical protein